MHCNTHAYHIASELARATRDQEEESRTLPTSSFSDHSGTDTFFHPQGRTDGNHYLEARAVYGNSSARSHEDISSLLPRIPLFDKRNVERVRR